jgi:PPM family protein phosphatase
MTLTFRAFGISDIGVCRPNNEDVLLSLPEIGFFAIADGMGGHKAGEIAAFEALNHLSKSVKLIKSQYCVDLMGELKFAIEKANQWVYNLSKTCKSLSGMGTTLCCLLWSGNEVIYAHVGDSRIYRFRKGKLELLTEDHSLFAKWLASGKMAEECETPFPYKNVITRAIGTASKTTPEVAFTTYEPEDLFFLCTDGLTDNLKLEEMEKILVDAPCLEKATQKLIDKAKKKGSSDNITILIVQCNVSI